MKSNPNTIKGEGRVADVIFTKKWLCLVDDIFKMVPDAVESIEEF